VDGIDLVRNRDKQRAIGNTVINDSIKCEEFSFYQLRNY